MGFNTKLFLHNKTIKPVWRAQEQMDQNIQNGLTLKQKSCLWVCYFCRLPLSYKQKEKERILYK